MAANRGPEYRYPAERRAARLGLACGGVGILVLVAAAYFGRSRQAPAKGQDATGLLSSMQVALDNVQTAAVTFISKKHGRGVILEKQYYDRGDWRIEKPGISVQLVRGEILHDYRVGGNFEIAFPAQSPPAPLAEEQVLGPQFRFGPVTLDSYKARAPFSISRGPAPETLFLRARQLGAQRLDVFSVGDSYDRTVVTVDPVTHLPSSFVQQACLKDGIWHDTLSAEIAYPTKLSKSLFDPAKLAPNVRRLDVQTAPKLWSGEAETSLGELDGSGSRLVVRAAQLNAKGDLFLAFSGNLAPSTRVVGQDGTLFVPIDWRNYVPGSAQRAFSWGWWAPVAHTRRVVPYEVSISQAGTAHPAKIAVTSADENMGPAYAVALSTPIDSAELSALRLKALESYFYNRWSSTPGHGSDRSALRQALELQRELVLAMESEPYVDILTMKAEYDHLASILRTLGRKQEEEEVVASTPAYKAAPQ